jgi:dynactin-4
VTQIGTKTDGLLKPEGPAGAEETYILQCNYCEWSSLEIGVHFNKPTKITEQLNKQRKTRLSQENKGSENDTPLSHDDIFANLTAFYKDQLSESGDPQNPYSNSPYSSPANLARIMSLYGGLSYNALKKSREKPQPMREAMAKSEGFASFKLDESDIDIIQKMQSLGWDGSTSSDQRLSTPFNNEARFTENLWPAATSLRTRRAKRCKTCRHIIARPDPKVGSMRYKIRLLAMNYIPRLSIRLLHPTTPLVNRAFHLRSEPLENEKLQPHQMNQYVLTIRNPIFETVKITLASPTRTPGKVASRVTILCPSFTVGPAGDVWDEALSASSQTTSDGGRKAAMASLTGTSESSDRQPEAGKIWEKTRNTTSVIVEITTGSLEPAPSIVPKTEQEPDDDELDEDDDLLEVPVYVRAEWEAEVKPGETLQGKKDASAASGERVVKELGYWVVLGVGKIAG